MLQDYTYVEPPNLSNHRAPAPAHFRTGAVPVPSTGTFDLPYFVAAVSRTLATQSGVNDVLVGLAADRTQVRILRVSWDENTRWRDLVAQIADDVKTSSQLPTLSEATQSLGLLDGQQPCLAVICVGSLDQASPPLHPIEFLYDGARGSAYLSASQSVFHPSVSIQALEQVVETLHFAQNHSTLSVHSIPTMQEKLLSFTKRLSADEITSVYQHAPLLPFVPDYLHRWVEYMPNATAVRWYDSLSLDDPNPCFESIAYEDLDRRTNQMANWLLRQGLKQDDRVAICLDRNIHFHVAMIGVMRSGGCYVPIDPELPIERKTYIVKDSGAKVVLSSPEIAPSFVEGSILFDICSPEIQIQIQRESATDPAQMRADGLAYLLYTSGTTGNPKGCLLTHEGFSQAIFSLSHTPATVEIDDIHQGRYLAVASIAFDVHLGETFVPIVLGMPLISARRTQLFENLPEYVNRLGITHLGIVPSLIEATLNAVTQKSDIALRYIASGGEKMSDRILDNWANHPLVRLGNFYGPSEVTIGCCARIMTTATPRGNIGRALANVAAYVVDSDMNILPRGGMGELVVEGPLVGRGYHGRPDLTQKVFMEWPQSGCWAYRTGDLVRMLPDGTIEILGRIDTQIKLRGVRIESEGISAIVCKARHFLQGPGLDANTILSRHPEIGIDQLVTFISWDAVPVSTRRTQKPYLVKPPSGLLKAVRDVCDIELPSYMRPSHVIPLSWLPLSSNGKADSKVLAAIFSTTSLQLLTDLSTGSRGEVDVKSSREATLVERQIFDILRQHTTVPFQEPFPHISIFECGMDSMAIIQLTKDLRDSFGRRVNAADIMKAQTLEGIAVLFDGKPPPANIATESTSSQDLEEIQSIYGEDVEAIWPPFTIQGGVLTRSTAEEGLYVQHVLLAFGSTPDVIRLRSVWIELVRMHPILRTVFHFGHDLAQVVLRSPDIDQNWSKTESVADKESSFASDFFAHKASTVAREINSNLSTIPPYRISVSQSPQATFLILSIHHSIYDGISLPQLILAFEQAYTKEVDNAPSVTRQIFEEISSVDVNAARTFWTHKFEGFHWPQFRLFNRSLSSPRRLVVPFKTNLTAFKRMASFQGVTLQTLFTATFAYLLSRNVYSSRDVVFGVIRSGRLLPVTGVETAILPLVSITPLRATLAGGDFLEAIQRSISAIVEFEHIPLGDVQRLLRGELPLFEAVFSCSVEHSGLGSLWKVLQSEPPTPDFPLAVEVVQSLERDSIRIQAVWTSADFDSVATDALSAFEQLAQLLAESSGMLLSGLPEDSHQVRIDSEQHGVLPAGLDPSLDGVESDLIDELRQCVATFMRIQPNLISPSTSLFSLGLDSIKSVGLSRALKKLGHNVSSIDILRHPSLSRLSVFIQDISIQHIQHVADQDDSQFSNLCQRIGESFDGASLVLSPNDAVTLYPTTVLQSGMLSQTIHSDGRLYVHGFLLSLRDDVDLDRMLASWEILVQQIDVLRTTFHFSVDLGVWVQAIHKIYTLSHSQERVDDPNELKSAVKNFFASYVPSTMDAFREPPLRVRVFSSSRNTRHLGFLLHHSLYDGVSIPILLQTVEAIYQGQTSEHYPQYHQLLPHIIGQEKRGAAFWLPKLRGLHCNRLLQTKAPSPLRVFFQEIKVTFTDDAISCFLSHGTPMQCLGQAAWSKVLAKLTGSSDIIFGHTVSGRSIPDADRVIGPVLNTIPCCVRLPPGSSNQDLVRSLHTLNTDGLEYQHVSLRALQKELGTSSLWDSLFLFQPQDETSERSSIWSFNNDLIPSEDEISVQYPINLEFYQIGSNLTVKCAAKGEYFTEAELRSLLEDVRDAALEVVSQPEAIAFEHLQGVAHPDSQTLAAAQSPSSSLSIDPKYVEVLCSVTNTPKNLVKSETSVISLGVDSISAIQITAKFKALGLALTTKDVLGSKTVGELFACLKPLESKALSQASDTPSSPPATRSVSSTVSSYFAHYPSKVESISPCPPGMSWLIGVWQRSEGTRFQHVFPLALQNGFPASKLEAAWRSLVVRHPILRSTFFCPEDGSDPLIVTFEQSGHEVWHEEEVDDNSIEGVLSNRLKSLVSSPLSSRGCPTRAVLLRSPKKSYFILHLHHFQYDAWSLQLLLHDLSNACQGMESLPSTDLKTFTDFCVPTSEVVQEQRTYWLKAFPVTPRPTFFPQLAVSQGSATSSQQRLVHTAANAIENASACEERARDLGISLQSVFLAAWARVQADCCLSRSSTFGLWTSGRSVGLDRIATMAVPCMNVLPLHVPDVRSIDGGSLAKSIQQDLRDRTGDIEQTRLRSVDEWIGAGDKPYYNVFVNIVKTGADTENQSIFALVQIPHSVPENITTSDDQLARKTAIASTMKDDLFIDIAVVKDSNSILISLDASASLIDDTHADILVQKWSKEVKNILAS